MSAGYLEEKENGLYWGRLIEGELIGRRKRFLADVRLKNNHLVTAHCPNTGSMLGCAQPGRPVWISRHDQPTRKLKYTWELIDMPDSLVGINTNVPNRLVKTAVAGGRVEALAGYDRIRSEVKTGDHTRLDLLLEAQGRRPCYVEIKNCTLVENGLARFPDAVTTRGRKHLLELAHLAESGGRALIFFLIQRMDAGRFTPADDIDPEYGRVLRRVVKSGVEVLAYDVLIDLDRIALGCERPVDL